ncbi:MAG: hypothetical protein KAR20_01240, partial [Candidatus Heimdallarchaeota archaeon]|nr:hypothetical protein [Candidatus Heimdallarchaeota archaeon]
MDEKEKVYKNKLALDPDAFKYCELPAIRDDFIAQLENALMFLSYRDLSLWHSEDRNKVHLNTFDGAWLAAVSLRHGPKDAYMLNPYTDDQVTIDMFPDLNLKWMSITGDIGSLHKIRMLPPKEKRNLIGIKSYRHVYSDRLAYLDYGKQRWWTD